MGQSRCRTAQCDRAADGHPPRGRRAVLERVHAQRRLRGSARLGARRHLRIGARPPPRRGGQRRTDHSRSSPAPSRCAICVARRWGRCAPRPPSSGRKASRRSPRAISSTPTVSRWRPRVSSSGRHGRETPDEVLCQPGVSRYERSHRNRQSRRRSRLRRPRDPGPRHQPRDTEDAVSVHQGRQATVGGVHRLARPLGVDRRPRDGDDAAALRHHGLPACDARSVLGGEIHWHSGASGRRTPGTRHRRRAGARKSSP